MTTDTASLVRQMRSALVAMHAVQFSTQTVTQRQYEDAKAAGEEAISTADQWLAQQEGDDTDWRAVARVQSAKLAVALDEPGAVARLESVMRGPDWRTTVRVQPTKLPAQQAREFVGFPVAGRDEGPRCRDCADNNGTCPHDGHKCGT